IRTAPLYVWLPLVVIGPPLRLIVSAERVRLAPAADRFRAGLTVTVSVPFWPSIASEALNPLPNPLTTTASFPSPALTASEPVGLANVVVSPAVEVTVVWPGVPGSATVIVSDEVP